MATWSTEALQRATRAEELANQRFRIRDVDADVSHMTEGGKQIDVFTEHVVELQVARRHVRVSDDARSVEVDALRLRVRDIARRRARVSDQESVMNVLTETVRVSDVVTRRLTAELGGRLWHAVGREVHTDGEEHERVEFGDLEEEKEAEPVVTMPEEEEDGGFWGSEDDVDGLTIEELCSVAKEGDITWTLCASEDCSEAHDGRKSWRKVVPRALQGEEQPQQTTSESPDREEELKRRLAEQPRCSSRVCQCPATQQTAGGRRKWPRRNRQANSGVGILNIRQKHNRRPLRHPQARARGTGGRH